MSTSLTESIRFKSIGIQLKRPPLARVLFDVGIQNPSDAWRWFLVRDQLDSPWELKSITANGVEAFELTGEGRVVIGHFHGNQGFLALLLPARAAISMHGIALSLWNVASARQAVVRVAVADALTIGHEAVGDWLGIDFASERLASVSAENRKELSDRYTSDRHDLPLQVQTVGMVETVVDIPSPKLEL